ncbi:MAG: HlyC/CorC family transporter [Actinobacteria bacterium]|nr:HlyC/CorC family transporter [Actinomycetota bacterium]
MTQVFLGLAVLLIVLANAFWVAAEYALVTARRSRLSEMAERGSRRAKIALRIMDSPVRFIGTVQLGITTFSILLGVVGEPIVEHWIDPPLLSSAVAFIIAFALVTYLHVTLGELVPKAIALQTNEATAMWVALPVEAFYLATYPVVWFLQASSNALTRLFGIDPAPAGVVAHTAAEIRMIVAAAEDTGVIEEVEEEMLYKVFDFADKEVHEVMVPRPQVVAISVDLPAEECLAAVIDSPYTRYPAYRGSLDRIVGILHVRDLFSAMNEHGIENVEVERLLRPAQIVPETKDLGALLADFRRDKQHMAIVMDEYSSMQGIVTLEDLVEEIVGEIEDEFDLPDESVEQVDDATVRVDGTFPIDDFNERFGTDLPVEDYHTLAGFVFGQLGRAPQEADEVIRDRLRFRVIQVEGSRIERLQVEFGGPNGAGAQMQPVEG